MMTYFNNFFNVESFMNYKKRQTNNSWYRSCTSHKMGRAIPAIHLYYYALEQWLDVYAVLFLAIEMEIILLKGMLRAN